MSKETRTVSATGGAKGTKLARFDLIPQGPLVELAEHFGVGALKYAGHQWRQGYEWSKSIAAKARHDAEFAAGRDYDVCSNDPEGCQHVDSEGNPFVAPREDACYNHTGSHHLAASAWHAFVLLEFKDRFPGFDDRYDPAADDEKYEDVMAERLDQLVVHDPAEPGQPLGPEWEQIGWVDGDLWDAAIQWRDPELPTRSAVTEFQKRINSLIWGLENNVIPTRFVCGIDPTEVTDEQTPFTVDMTLLRKRPPRDWVAEIEVQDDDGSLASALIDIWVDSVGATD